MASEERSIKERLSKLPRRAIVAFAVRCARRVQPLLIVGFEHWGNVELRENISEVDSGLSNLEKWCVQGKELASIDKEAISLFHSAMQLRAAAANATSSFSAANATSAFSAAAVAADAANSANSNSNSADAADAAEDAAIAAANANANANRGIGIAIGIDRDRDRDRDISFLEESLPMTSDRLGGWIDPSDSGPMGPVWGKEPPTWYLGWKPNLDEFLGRTPSGEETPERIRWELERVEKDLAASRRQVIAAQASAEAKLQEIARLDASFNKQSEAIKTYEENLVAQREQLAMQQEHAAELQKRLSEAVAAAAEAQAAREIASANAMKLESELASKQTRSFGDIWRDLRTGKLAWDDIRSAAINLTLWAIMGGAGLLVFITLSEISSRQQLEALITNELGHVRSELAKSPAPTPAAQPNKSAGSTSNEAEKAAPPLRKQLDGLEQGLKDIRRLVTNGTSSMNLFASEISERTRSPLTDSPKPPSSVLSWSDWLWFGPRFWLWSNSEFLLALVVSACGGIGSLIALIREDNRRKGEVVLSHGRDRHAMEYGQLFMLGLSTGFLAFFIVRGGKAVFLLQGDAVSFPTNPYTTSFAGLIAGIFTERAYGLLMDAVTQLEKKIRQVINEPSTNKTESRIDPTNATNLRTAPNTSTEQAPSEDSIVSKSSSPTTP